MRSAVLTLSIAFLALTPRVAQAQSDGGGFERVRSVVIDPGHGGTDGGALGVAGIAEKDLTLEVSLALRDALLAVDPALAVSLTRDDDTYPSLEERTHLANQIDADVFLSLHFNTAPNPLAQGVEVFYLAPEGTAPGESVPGREEQGPANPQLPVGVAGDLVAVIVDDLQRAAASSESGQLAQSVLGGLLDATDANDRGVRQAQFRVLRGARMPAVVVEFGFLTHAVEGKRLCLPETHEALVAGLVEGLRAYDRWMREANRGTPRALAAAE